MGIKRLGRKRLAAIEKLGILKDISPGDAMKDAIVSATQHREGQKVVTDIVLDFGTSKVSLLSKANPAVNSGVGLVVSDDSNKGHICKISDSVFGIVTSVEAICLEAITDGTLADYDLRHGTIASAGTLGVEPSGTPVDVLQDIGAIGAHKTVAYDEQELKDRYLFLASGAVSSQKATATIECDTAVVGNITTAVTTVRLINSAGVAKNFKADSGVDWNDTTPKGSGVGGLFGIGNTMDDKYKLTQALSLAIDEMNDFTTDTPSKTASSGGDTTTTITVTHAATTVTNNQTNYLVNDDPQAASGIDVGAFTGGIDDGQAISSGKLLIRVTGFMSFDDVE